MDATMAERSFPPEGGRLVPDTVSQSERRESLEHAAMDRRQSTVATLLELDRVLSASDSGVDSAMVNRLIARLPPDSSATKFSIRHAAREAVNEYGTLLKAAIHEENFLKKKASEKFGDNSPETVAAMLFTARTGKHPVGQVSLVRREGYFIMTCPNPADYNVFYDPALEDRKADDFTKQVEILNRHGGSMHTSITLDRKHGTSHWDLGDISSSFIVLKTVPDAYGFDVIVTHERQHFLNHRLMKVFAESENPRRHEAKTDIETAARFIKDEVIAYLRDGSTGAEIDTNLKEETYRNLFENLSPKEVELLHGILSNITTSMSKDAVFSDPASRRAMAIQLIDIPFVKIPDWMPVIAGYYQETLHRIDEIAPPTDMISQKDATSPEFATYRLRLDQAVLAYERVRRQAIDAVYLSAPGAVEAILADLRVKRAVVARDLESMKTSGVVVPSGNYRFVDPNKTHEVTTRKIEIAARELSQEILTKLTRLSTSERSTFVQRAHSGKDPAFSDALNDGVGDAIVRPLLARGAENTAVSRQDGEYSTGRAFVYLKVEATFPHLDPIHKIVFRFLIHGKPERTEPVFKS